MSRAFRFGHARGNDWREAAESCLSQLGNSPANLGFLYATDLVSDDMAEIVGCFRRRTGIEHWVGTVGIGICASGVEYADEPALAVMVGEFDPATFRVFSGIAAAADLKAQNLKCGDGSAHFAVVHADPQNERLPQLVDQLAARVESGFLVGGLTSSRRRNLQIADGIVDGGVSGVVFSDQVTVATRLTQGCSPAGPRHVITEGERNVIVSLDRRPALEVFKQDIGPDLTRDLNRLGGTIFAGLPIAGSDTGDYLVRHLVGIDPTQQLIAIGDSVKPGAQVMFCRRDAGTAREDMSRMLASIKQGLYTQPRAGLYYSCLGRGAGLFGPGSAELKMIQTALGDFPLVGFFCNGEISHNRLYGYTGVLTLFV